MNYRHGRDRQEKKHQKEFNGDSRGARISNEKKEFLEGIGVPKDTKFVIDDFQKEAIESVVMGNDTLVVAPTGSGKTYIALEAIKANAEQGGRSIYTTPLKALSNTKYNDFKKRFEPQFKVGILTGDRKIDTDANILIATTEIYRNELYKIDERYSLVVFDEVHYIADPQRGAVWEESIILSSKEAALLMLSASISNAEEIAAWLKEVRGKDCHIVYKYDRPVELRYGFLHPDFGPIPLNDKHGNVCKDVLDYYGKAGLDESGMKFKKIAFTKTYRGDEGRNRNRVGGKGSKKSGRDFRNNRRGRKR